MPYIPSELQDIAKRVAQGEQPQVSVRTLLGWFAESYRTKRAIREIDAALAVQHVKTDPHYNLTWLDGLISFLPAATEEANTPAAPTVVNRQVTLGDSLELLDSVALSLAVEIDPTYRIRRLKIAHRIPTSVAPDATVQHAVTLMLKNDFSQLPAMSTEREVKGLFSWKSLGSRVSQGQACTLVREAIDRHCEVTADASLFSVIPLIQEHDCILIRDSDRKIVGIMTAYDISATFGHLAEPFLVLGEIENHIRNLIRSKFTLEELVSNRDPGDLYRKIEAAEDLTFGEYIHLLENPERWTKLCLQIDRNLFVKDLDEIRRIRNDVMHFDPEGISESDRDSLRNFAEFLRRLERLRKK